MGTYRRAIAKRYVPYPPLTRFPLPEGEGLKRGCRTGYMLVRQPFFVTLFQKRRISIFSLKQRFYPFFLLLANLPIPGYPEFMAGIFGPDWAAALNAVAGGTFNVLALIVVLTITYKFVEAEGYDAMMAAILALSTFLILLPPTMNVDGVTVANVIPKSWAGSNGVITAILVAFLTSYVFCYCIRNHLTIKMPASVPASVTKAFTALIPGTILFTIAAVLYGLCHFIGATTLPELIFKLIQTPLQSLSDTLAGGIVIVGLLLDGWQGGVVQLINLVIATALYYPFLRAQDKAMLADEGGETENASADVDEEDKKAEA